MFLLYTDIAYPCFAHIYIQCGKLFTTEDAVPINGTEEEMKKLREKMVERRQLAKATKVCVLRVYDQQNILIEYT